jgi:hypothetical protein
MNGGLSWVRLIINSMVDISVNSLCGEVIAGIL